MLKPLTVWITTNWKTLKEMGLPDHLICLLRNLYTGQEATVKEKEMATHSSVLAKRIPGMAEPGGLPSMGSHRVRHDRRDLA